MIKFCVIISLLSLCLAFNISRGTRQQTNLKLNWPFSVCGNATWDMKSLTLDRTPARNVDVQIVASGIVNDHIQFKSVELTAKVNGLFLHSESVPFSKTYDEGDTIDFVFHSFVPSFAPAGTYTLSFIYKTTNDKDNGCWFFTFKL